MENEELGITIIDIVDIVDEMINEFKNDIEKLLTIFYEDEYCHIDIHKEEKKIIIDCKDYIIMFKSCKGTYKSFFIEKDPYHSFFPEKNDESGYLIVLYKCNDIFNINKYKKFTLNVMTYFLRKKWNYNKFKYYSYWRMKRYE